MVAPPLPPIYPPRPATLPVACVTADVSQPVFAGAVTFAIILERLHSSVIPPTPPRLTQALLYDTRRWLTPRLDARCVATALPFPHPYRRFPTLRRCVPPRGVGAVELPDTCCFTCRVRTCVDETLLTVYRNRRTCWRDYTPTAFCDITWSERTRYACPSARATVPSRPFIFRTPPPSTRG